MGKLNDIIREASNKGYYVLKDGTVRGKTKILNPSINGSGYKFFSIRFNKNREVVLVHRLQAYQKFGEGIFKDGVQVRHLNSNKLDNTFKNIGLGTSSDNNLDKPKEIRIKAAIKASRKFQGTVRSYEDRCKIYDDLISGLTYSEILKKHNLTSKSTLSFMKNKSLEFKQYKNECEL